MDVHNLSFNAVISNIEDDCVTFFCPVDCRFMKTLAEDLDVNIKVGDVPFQRDTVCVGKVYKSSQVKRLPMIYSQETDAYYDILLIYITDKQVQVVILRNDSYPDTMNIQKEYDAYKLYYEYVGSMNDLKSRMNYEYTFLKQVEGSSPDMTMDEAFRHTVDAQIIKKLFE